MLNRFLAHVGSGWGLLVVSCLVILLSVAGCVSQDRRAFETGYRLEPVPPADADPVYGDLCRREAARLKRSHGPGWRDHAQLCLTPGLARPSLEAGNDE